MTQSIKASLFFIVIMLFGCSSTTSSTQNHNSSEEANTSSSTEEVLGIGLTELVDKRQTFSPTPIPNYYYGQLLIDTKITKKAVTGPQAKKLMNFVIELFGSERKQFGLSVVPDLNGVKLPELVIFSYSFDSNSNTWRSSLTRKYRSPAIPLNDFSRLGFKFKFVSSDDKEVKLVESVADIVSGYAGVSPGTWVMSSYSTPMVKEAASVVDNIISKILSESIESNVDNVIEPTSDGSREVVYSVSTSDGDKIAEVNFSARLFNSIVSGKVLKNESVPSNYLDAIPEVDPFTNPLNRIKVSGNDDKTLGDELASSGALRELTNTNDPDTFRMSCRKIIDTLGGKHGLNVFDKLNAFRNALALTKFVKDKTLYDSGCLTSNEFELLEKMGVPLRYEGATMTTKLNNETLLKLAGFFKSPVANHGFEKDILNLFAETVRVNSGDSDLEAFPEEMAIVDRQSVINRLKLLKAARVCCWGGPVHNGKGEPIPNTRPIYFRTLMSRVLYSIELYQSGTSSPVDFVRIRPLQEEEISDWKMSLLMEPAKDNVEGYTGDILLR